MTEKKRMALIINGKGLACSAVDGQAMIIYEGAGDDWEEISELEYHLDPKDNIEGMRSSMKRICSEINDCTAVIGTSIIGLPYHMFDKAGLKILEVQDFDIEDLEFLEGMIDLKEEPQGEIPQPVSEMSDGNYTFDLIHAQSEHPELSSKMLLKEFVETSPFISLSLLCEHLPPWIEELAKDNRIEISQIKEKSGVRIMIRRGCIAKSYT